jgi:hypothetical protein
MSYITNLKKELSLLNTNKIKIHSQLLHDIRIMNLCAGTDYDLVLKNIISNNIRELPKNIKKLLSIYKKTIDRIISINKEITLHSNNSLLAYAGYEDYEEQHKDLFC